MMPKISVLLPAYNHQDYIGATIESLLGQQEKNIEIIAVDDGSTDRTGEILDRYARQDPRLKVFHKENGGVVSALNYGLDHVSGVWLASCGSDDVVPRNAYSYFLKAEQDADIIIGEFIEFDDSGRRTRVRLGHRTGHSGFEDIFAMPATWNKLIRMDLIRRADIRFPDVRICEDLILLAELATQKPRCRFIPRVVYEYRNNASLAASMSHQYSAQTFQDHLDGRLAVEQICRRAGIPQSGTYVFRDSLPYLSNYLLHLSGSDQVQAIGAFRKFMLQSQSQLDEEQFELLFAVSWPEFQQMTDDEYASRIHHITHEEWVLRKYQAGEIGLSFLLRCARNWLAYKKRNGGKRHGDHQEKICRQRQ